MVMLETEDDAGDDRPLAALDDRADRAELRRRYYGLLQELRVLVPGSQILVAFLLTAPFADRFPQVDHLGRVFYGIALTTSVLSVITFITPTAIHRVGHRRSRVGRLRWSIRTMRLGLVSLGVALTSAFLVVSRAVFDDWIAWALAGAVVATMVSMWVVVPHYAGRSTHTPTDAT